MEMTDRERLVGETEAEPHYTNAYDNSKLKAAAPTMRQPPIDFVLAAKNTPYKKSMSDKDLENARIRKKYFHSLKKKHLKISHSHISTDEKTVFWHIHAPFEVLADTAEDLNLKLPTIPSDIKLNQWYDGIINWWSKKNPFAIHLTYFPPRSSYFSDTFDKNRLEEFYPICQGGDKEDLFPQAERSRLVSYILDSTSFGDSDEKIGKSCLLNMGVFTAAYPCHDGFLLDDELQRPTNNRQKLQKEWASFRKLLRYQPLQGICDYFGVKIAFYYAWMGFYTTWLVPASFIGVLCFLFGCLSIFWSEQIKEICNDNKPFYMCPLCDKLCTYHFLHKSTCFYSKITHCFDNFATPLFAGFMSIWSIFYLEYWKRKEWCLAYEWHTIDFHEEEVVRPQYTASAKRFKKNPVTGKMEPFNSKKDQWLKIAGEASVVFFFICLVLGSIVGVIVYRAVIFGVLLASGLTFKKHSKMIVTGTAATINLIVINILKTVYQKLALIMTDWENPRTRTLYEKSFTVKMFWFQFCNTFASVFYVAFFKSETFVGWPGRYRRFGRSHSRFEGCSEHGCFLELCVQLVILMAGQQLFGNIVEIGWPWLQKKYNTWRNEVWKVDNITVWEKDYQLAEQEELSLFWEYQEVVLQYGFVTMFVAAFPLAPLVALVTNLVEIRIDAINMIQTFRRPVAYKSEGIGVWYDILVTLTTLAVLINGFVIAISSEFIPKLVYSFNYSLDGSLDGYMEWSLSHFNVSDYAPNERPETVDIDANQTFCRYPGFHDNRPPYGYSEVHWYIMTVRLVFAFLFQWTVSAAGRVLSWIIPDKPATLDMKMKRQEFLSKEALRKYKVKIGERPEEEEEGNCSSDNEDDDAGDYREMDGALGTNYEDEYENIEKQNNYNYNNNGDDENLNMNYYRDCDETNENEKHGENYEMLNTTKYQGKHFPTKGDDDDGDDGDDDDDDDDYYEKQNGDVEEYLPESCPPYNSVFSTRSRNNENSSDGFSPTDTFLNASYPSLEIGNRNMSSIVLGLESSDEEYMKQSEYLSQML